jgi:hypothetical protein
MGKKNKKYDETLTIDPDDIKIRKNQVIVKDMHHLLLYY